MNILLYPLHSNNVHQCDFLIGTEKHFKLLSQGDKDQEVETLTTPEAIKALQPVFQALFEDFEVGLQFYGESIEFGFNYDLDANEDLPENIADYIEESAKALVKAKCEELNIKVLAYGSKEHNEIAFD